MLLPESVSILFSRGISGMYTPYMHFKEVAPLVQSQKGTKLAQRTDGLDVASYNSQGKCDNNLEFSARLPLLRVGTALTTAKFIAV